MRCFPLILVLINLALAIAAHILILFETVLDGCIYLLLHRIGGKASGSPFSLVRSLKEPEYRSCGEVSTPRYHNVAFA